LRSRTQRRGNRWFLGTFASIKLLGTFASIKQCRGRESPQDNENRPLLSAIADPQKSPKNSLNEALNVNNNLENEWTVTSLLQNSTASKLTDIPQMNSGTA